MRKLVGIGIFIVLLLIVLSSSTERILLNKYYGLDSAFIEFTNTHDEAKVGIDTDQNLTFQDSACGIRTLCELATSDVCLSSFIGIKQKTTSEFNLHGQLNSLSSAVALNSGTPINSTVGIGKVVISIIAASDFTGTITITGTSVNRNTGAETGADTDVITIDALTTDATTTDANSNTVHDLVDAYISSKWFKGAVTITTTDITCTDVDVYQCAFEQFNDIVYIDVKSLDISTYVTNATAELDAYLYAVDVTGSKVTIQSFATINLTSVTANKTYRLRRGALNKILMGDTDGIFLDVFLYPTALSYLEDINIKVWAKTR